MAKMIRTDELTHGRLRSLAKEIGVSQTALLRALTFANPEDYLRFERRRLGTKQARAASKVDDQT